MFPVADTAYSALALAPSVFLTSLPQTMPHIRSLRSLQNNKEGVEQWREGSSLRGWQTDSEPACPLSSDRQMSPLPAWPAADQGRARRLLKWRNLRAPQGVSWSFDVQHKGRVWCWMSWERETQPLQSVTKAGLIGWEGGKKYCAQTDHYYISSILSEKMVTENLWEFGVRQTWINITKNDFTKSIKKNF